MDHYYDEIIELCIKLKLKYKIKEIDKDNRNYYNFFIYNFIYEYICYYNRKGKVKLIKTTQHIFNDLIKKILINNHNNIKYYLTSKIIFLNHKLGVIIFNYFEKFGLLYYLETKTKDTLFMSKNEKIRFMAINEAKINKLRWTWLAAIYKAGVIS